MGFKYRKFGAVPDLRVVIRDQLRVRAPQTAGELIAGLQTRNLGRRRAALVNLFSDMVKEKQLLRERFATFDFYWLPGETPSRRVCRARAERIGDAALSQFSKRHT